jgi:hypothetical protein
MKNVPKQRMNIESLFPHKGNICSQLTLVYWFRFNWPMLISIEQMFLSHFVHKSNACTQHKLVHWFKLNWTILKNIMSVVSHLALSIHWYTDFSSIEQLSKNIMNVVSYFARKGNICSQLTWVYWFRFNWPML